MNGPEASFDRAWDALSDALEDEPPLAHIRAYKALLDADRALSYAELANAIDRSGRQTKRVIRDLEDADLIDRRVSTADYNRHVFEPAAP